MKKEIKSDPPEDIPAWFMTYSDVITLLMTFFILLLTFATTEPERFEKVTISFNGEAGATGVAGHKHDQLDKDSYVQRYRPRAARIAMSGSEIPPMEKDHATKSVGRGLEAVNEEQAKKDVMNSFSFELKISELVNENNNVTQKGMQIAGKLSSQLKSLPVHCALEISSISMAPRASAFAHHLYHVEKTRPGQVGIGMVTEMDSEIVRFVMERYEK
ncbi:MAG: flagellar motor protein MotB [Pirellulaceae bacterium]